jgi:bile acid:Na+ symporter, BASS family
MQESILTTLVLPVALALIMLGLGLSLKSDDFLRIFKYPKAVTIGLIGQLVILPVIALAIVKIIPMPPAIAVGLIVLALCPCGASSNMMTYLAGGDVALAVTLTVFSSIITIFTIPLFTSLAVNSFLGTNALAKPTVGNRLLPNWGDNGTNIFNYSYSDRFRDVYTASIFRNCPTVRESYQ